MLVSFTLAKIAKELGFNWKTVEYYDVDKSCSEELESSDCERENFNRFKTLTSAPTLAELQKWVREVLKKHVVIICHSENEWTYHYLRLGDSPNKLRRGTYTTYERALEAGLLNIKGTRV